MRRVLVTPIVLLWHLFSYSSSMENSTDENVLSTELFDFALDLHLIVGNIYPDQNTLLSPASIATVLAVTGMGAKEDTKQQIKDALGIGGMDDVNINLALHQINAHLDLQNSNVTLQTANRLFIQNGCKPYYRFLYIVNKFFKSGLTYVNFQRRERARRVINKWVERSTKGKIREIINSESLNDLTKLVLVNAIYFKAYWSQPFDPSQTKSLPFYISAEEHVVKDMMSRRGEYKYYRDGELKCKIIELPYSNGEVSMFIIIPDETEGLYPLEESLSAEILLNMITKMKLETVNLVLPKFIIENQFSLKDTLISLGVLDLFTPEADLSALFGKKGDLYVSAAEHKAYIEVNEEGTEAAAATSIIKSSRMLTFQMDFIADRPFFFLIKENISNAPLFIGRYIGFEEDD